MSPAAGLRSLMVAGLFLALSAASDPAAKFRLTPSEDSGPVVLALIDLKRGYPNGDAYCPPDIDWETEICLGASIVIHRGRIERRYGWSDNVDHKWRARKFKEIGGHAVRRVEGGRWVAVIEQTDRDHWYVQWKAPIEHRRFCLPEAMVAHYQLKAPPSIGSQDGASCYRV